eukprot:2864811-Pleurochrysis_carterae.AAC.1
MCIRDSDVRCVDEPVRLRANERRHMKMEDKFTPTSCAKAKMRRRRSLSIQLGEPRRRGRRTRERA